MITDSMVICFDSFPYGKVMQEHRSLNLQFWLRNGKKLPCYLRLIVDGSRSRSAAAGGAYWES